MTRSAQSDHAALAALLASQHQVISRKQALARGMSERALQYRVRIRGSWQRLLPGVFLAVTGMPTDDQRDVAAQLYAGPDGLITGKIGASRGLRSPHP